MAAIKAAQLGLRTACVEKGKTLGGTCLNVGCIPSKSLLHNSHLFHMARSELSDRGIIAENVQLDLPKMLRSKDATVSQLTRGIEMLFRKNRVTSFLGSTGTVEPGGVVALSGAHTQRLRAKHIILATGSEPTPIPGIEVDEEAVLTSTGALSLGTVPEHLVVIGGGVIGLELGMVWKRLGARVTVVEAMQRIGGAGMDGQVAQALEEILKKQGIAFLLQHRLNSLSKGGKLKIAISDSRGSGDSVLECDRALLCVGRRAFTGGLGLDAVGVGLDDRGRISVDPETFATNVPGIYAIGDAVAGPMLAHKAEEDAVACVERIATGQGHVDYAAVPSVLYTHPEVAWVGATEEKLRAQGVDYVVGSFPFFANSRALASREPVDGFVKVLSDRKTDKMLGVHIIGPNAGEMIAEATLALKYGASSEDVARTCHPHPTLSEALREACLLAHSPFKAINL